MSRFIKLALPDYEYVLKTLEGKKMIFDHVRKKYVLLTPEEWVRQHFINFLMVNQYPKNLIRVEGGHTYFQLQKRSDVLVYDRNTQPFLLVECKASDVLLSQQTVNQVVQYNAVLKAPYIVLTNGLQHLFYAVDAQNGAFLALNGLPAFP